MQENTQKPLNGTGKSCLITVDDLESYFVEPFTDPESRQWRLTLCAGFRAWLTEIKNYGVCLDVWVNGQFITYAAKPEYVDVACVIRSYPDVSKQKGLSKFDCVIKNSDGGWAVRNQYRCSIKLKLLHFSTINKYDDIWFEGFEHYKSAGKRSGVFTISLQ
jgi:hypothetical protein